MSRPQAGGDRAAARRFAVDAARLVSDRHCEEVQVLDVGGISQVCDYIIIASGTSDRQMKSVASEIIDLGEEMDHPCFRTNRDTGVTWIVIDFVGVVVHLLEPSQREYYALEQLWSDATEVTWQRDESASAS